MTYFRGYAYTCVCGRKVEGKYAITAAEWKEGARLDPERAVCQQARGKAAGQPRSVTDIHYVGCGRTLAKSDFEVAERKAMPNARLAPVVLA